MLVGGGKLILTKGDAKFTEAQVHGPDDGVLLLSKGAEAFDDLEAAHSPPPPYQTEGAPTSPAIYRRSGMGALKKS